MCAVYDYHLEAGEIRSIYAELNCSKCSELAVQQYKIIISKLILGLRFYLNSFEILSNFH